MDNEIVYREAELMYKMAPGFTPVNGNLKHWTGEIKFKSEDRVSNCLIDILLPENFPSSPPTVSSLTGLRHSTIDPATGRFALKILRDWKPKNHVYEIVNAIKDEFSRKSPKLLGSLKPISKPSAIREPPSYNSLKDLEVKIKDLEEEIEGLRKNIAEKNAEISRLQTVLKTKSLSSNLPAEQSPSDSGINTVHDIEAERNALEDLIKDLEMKFEAGDITAEEYSKLSKKYRKQLYLINKEFTEPSKNNSSV